MLDNPYEASRFLTGPDLPQKHSTLSNATIEAAVTKRIKDVMMVTMTVFDDAIGIGVIVPKYLKLNGDDDISEIIMATAPAKSPVNGDTLLNAIDQIEEDIKRERKITGLIGLIK